MHGQNYLSFDGDGIGSGGGGDGIMGKNERVESNMAKSPCSMITVPSVRESIGNEGRFGMFHGEIARYGITCG